MEFRILGPLEVMENGQALELGGQKLRALVAMLLLHANEVVSSDRLIEALWEDEPPETAPKALQVYVSQLRKLLGRERLETKAPGYRLRVQEGELDLERFRRLSAEGKPEEALVLWRGPPLSDFVYQSFAQAEIARLEELRLTCLEERIEHDLAAGRHAGLVSELDALLSEQPLRERLRGQLMLALYRSGRQAEALEAYQEGRRLLVEELGIEPSPELQELHRAILNQAAALALASEQVPAWSLPTPANPLIGRREELRAISDVLLGEARLVTLTGAGGSGKTRLALQVATALQAEFGQQVCFVTLAPLQDAELVPTTLMSALGVKEAAGEPPLETLRRSLRERALLLVLDNFEHLLEAAPLLAELLADCPRLKLLVTSRASLHLSGEHEYPLDPLPLKQARTLFTERARAVRPDFAADDAVLAAICERLDCLPLALELAAARTRSLSPDDLLGRLEHRLELLTGGPHDLASRQQTLRATIDWSFELLGPDEQEVFAGLAVFAGGCTLEAAERVCAASLDQLESLVDKNLLRRREAADENRFWMLETVREYALERLETAGEVEATRRAHADYFLALAQRSVAEIDLAQLAALEALERDLDNFRSAFAWTQEADPESALRLAAALSRSWYARDQLVEGRRWLEGVLSGQHTPSRELAVVAAELARLHVFLGELELAGERVDQALALAEALGLRDVLSEALNTKGILLEMAGRHDEALAFLERALAIAREHDLTAPLLRALFNFSYLLSSTDRLVEAKAIYLEGLEYARRLGSHFQQQRFLGQLLWTHMLLGDWEAALAVAEETVQTSLPGRLGDSFGPLPWLRVQRGEIDEARRALEAQAHLAGSDDAVRRAVYATAEAVVLRAEGRPREALAAAAGVLTARDIHSAGYENLKMAFAEAIEAAFALDDLDRVEELLLEWAEMPAAERTPFREAQLARFGARLAARGDHSDEVEPALTRATALFRKLSMPFYVAVTLLEDGEWLIGQGRSDDAEPLLAEAREIFERLEAKPWLERATPIVGTGRKAEPVTERV
jgi:predicted ATPase/DNA-binding SARP family transcriptional activator